MICIFGPTAVGKTKLVYELIKAIPNLEIINADSVQVYKELSIGSAHPTPDLLELVPHHLVEVLSPTERFSSADFVAETKRIDREVRARGGLPVVLGGTAFYIKQLVWGIASGPKANPETRAMLRARLDEEGLPALYEELKSIDPRRAEALPPNDAYRICRALEICIDTGALASDCAPEAMTESADILIGLMRPREELVARIAARVDQMFAEGLIDEVKGLIARYGTDIPALGAIGYREFVEGLATNLSYDEIREKIVIHTRQFAKRQMTFFKKFPGTTWINPSEDREIARICDIIIKNNQ